MRLRIKASSDCSASSPSLIKEIPSSFANHSENARLVRSFDSASSLPYLQITLTCTFIAISRSVATKDQILVPETLLKKRKAQDKSREKNIADLEKRKKVGLLQMSFSAVEFGDDTAKHATRPLGQCCRLSYTIFRD